MGSRLKCGEGSSQHEPRASGDEDEHGDGLGGQTTNCRSRQSRGHGGQRRGLGVSHFESARACARGVVVGRNGAAEDDDLSGGGLGTV